MKRISCIAVTAAMAVATGLTVETALPQSRYDFDDQGRPVERYVVHASCNSKTLPDAGFKIARRVPGRDKECYWVRDNLGPGGDASLPDYAKSEESLPGAMQAARRNHETTLQKIAAQRTSDLHSFLQKIENCGASLDCQSAVIEQRVAADRVLDRATNRAALDLGFDQDRIGRYFARAAPQGAAARPGR